jgi:hypothetical protein
MRHVTILALVMSAAIVPLARAETIDVGFQAQGLHRIVSSYEPYELTFDGDTVSQPFRLETIDILGFPGEIDTTAQTAQLLSISTRDVSRHPRVFSHTFITGPPVFPNPAPTATWEVFIRPQVFSWGQPQIASSTVDTVELTSMSPTETLYTFMTAIQVSAPETLTIAGLYRITGPSTTTGLLPYSQTFRRVEPEPVEWDGEGRIRVRQPRTIYDIRFGNEHVATYEADSPLVYEHTVDGAEFRLNMTSLGLSMEHIPEPTSQLLAAMFCAILGLKRVRTRRSNLRLDRQRRGGIAH